MSNRIVAGRYELLTIVGRGGMSIVHLARDLTLNKNWAVKEIAKTGIIQGQKVSNSLLAEAEMMMHLDHPALPRIVDIVDEANKYYIVMDYVEGENLKSILEKKGMQEQEDVIRWGIELTSVLEYLHSQDPPIIYRDMKPANIILQPNGSLKLIDFGIARTYKEDKNQDTTPLGTKGYAAPEQYDRGHGQSGQTDARTDIFNLGVTLYELLTNRLPNDAPYNSVAARNFNPTVSAGLDTIIEKCIRHDPNDRIQNATELMTALLNYRKFDIVYIQEQKKILRKSLLPAFAGAVCIAFSLVLFILNGFVISNSYDSLIAPTGNHQSRIENLEKAIEIKPDGPEAYQYLVEEYAADGLTEKESEQIFSVTNKSLSGLSPKSEEYLDINFMLGESYLVYYTGSSDNSLRNKVMTAQPFFEAVISSGKKDYDKYELSQAYVYLAEFYRSYILEDDAAFVKDASEDTYAELFKDFDMLIKKLSSSDESENNQLKLVSYSIMLNILDVERYNIAECMSYEEVSAVIGSIRTAAEDNILTSNSKLQDQKETILDQCDDLEKIYKDTYKNQKKVEELPNEKAAGEEGGEE